MKISELISKLTKELAEHGDIEVQTKYSYSVGGCCCSYMDHDWESLSYIEVAEEGTTKNPIKVIRLYE